MSSSADSTRVEPKIVFDSCPVFEAEANLQLLLYGTIVNTTSSVDSLWDWLSDDLQRRILGFRTVAVIFGRCVPFPGEHFFSWWLKTVPLEAFVDIEREYYTSQGIHKRAISTMVYKRKNFYKRASNLHTAVKNTYRVQHNNWGDFEDHLSVWYDQSRRKSVHNCVYLFEPYPKARVAPTVRESICVQAFCRSLPAPIMERFVRVRIVDGYLRFFFLGRDVDPFAVDNIPSYHHWNDYHRCRRPRPSASRVGCVCKGEGIHTVR